MSNYKILTPELRKGVIDKICFNFDGKSFDDLKTVLDWTTGAYHYTIRNPDYGQDEAFLFVTELFGNPRGFSKEESIHLSSPFRVQYHGNFNGLVRVVRQYMSPGKGINGGFVFAKGNKITDEQRNIFDRAWEDLSELTRYAGQTSKTFIIGTDMINHTYSFFD